MTLIATLKTWLPAPPVTGGWAMAGAVALIAFRRSFAWRSTAT